MERQTDTYRQTQRDKEGVRRMEQQTDRQRETHREKRERDR